MRQLPLVILLTLLVVPTFIIGGWLTGSLVMQSLARYDGDPAAGRKLALDPDKGDCVICHQVHPEAAEQQGNVGPQLMEVAERLSEAELFDRIKDPRRFNPETLMPPYGSTKNLHRVADEFRGKPILTDEEIEDIVAWLTTLNSQSPRDEGNHQ